MSFKSAARVPIKRGPPGEPRPPPDSLTWEQVSRWLSEHPGEAVERLPALKLAGAWVEPSKLSSSDKSGPFTHRPTPSPYLHAANIAKAREGDKLGPGFLWWLGELGGAHGRADTMAEAMAQCDAALRAAGWSLA